MSRLPLDSRRPFHITAMLAAAALVAAPAALADTPWTPLGPTGGRVCALAGDPRQDGAIYAGGCE